MDTEFFVSPTGSDAWSGKLPEQVGDDGPFATVARAQQAVRQLRSDSAGGRDAPAKILLRGGLYLLDAPLVFTPEDGGARRSGSAFRNEPLRPVTYGAFPGERPVLSGGRRIAGWREEQRGGRTVWVTELPAVARGEWYFRQLFVNGARRMRPRLPTQGFYQIAELVDARFEGRSHETWQHGADRFVYAGPDIQASWHNLQDVEVVVVAFWDSLHMKIKSVDETTRTLTLDRNSGWRMSDDFSREGAYYYVENVFEELKEPGQWYLERRSGLLYYLPLPGETIETVEAIAPCLPELVRVQGTAETPVRALRFEGLTFSHTEWHLPDGEAMADVQAARALPGAVTLRHAEECRVEHCTFTHLGGNYCVELLDESNQIGVVGCGMSDVGGGGVKIGDGCRRNQVTDCEMGPLGLIFHAAVGVLIGRACGNQVLHNHIHHLFYSGISVGWNWGYADGDCYGNVIEWNHIHDFGQGMLSDIGGIYTLGPQAGTRLRYNVIHHGYRRKYGDQGIYLDEGSSDILIEGNLIYRCQCGFSETGRDNTFRNNIFALGREYQMRPYTMGGVPPHRSFLFENNIVYYTHGDLFSMEKEDEHWVWSPEYADYRGNLYFCTSGDPLSFRGQSFGEWQQEGRDVDGAIADPLFVDPEHGDFRLQPGSPALALGFREVDFTRAGPRPEKRAPRANPESRS